MINEFMEKLVLELNLPKSIAIERGGVYTIPLDEETSVKVSDVPPGFALFSIVAPCPENKKEEFFAHLLHGNLFGQGTDGAQLGLTEEGNYLTLTNRFEYPITYKEFKDIIEEFLNVVDFWREEARMHKAGKLNL